MSSPTAPPESPPPHQVPENPPTESEVLIDRKLRQTRRQLRAVDVADGLIVLAVGALAYLLAAAVIDHWLLIGGIGKAWRLILFVGLVGTSGAFFARRVLPVLVHRINPIFAAHAIEESRPSLKNSLLNFLFLRRQKEAIGSDALARQVFQGLERSTAADLAQIEIDTTVDRSPVIRHGYLLVLVLAICCLYLLLSPKSPLTSFGRIIWPLADIKAPTRVTIDQIEPGSIEAFQGDTIVVTAEIHGLKDDESVLVYYTTADGQSVNQAIVMTLDEDAYRHRCDLPPSSLGLQQNVTYYLAAGDCRSDTFTIDVQTALAILVDSVRYDYPEYTGLGTRTVRGVGDVRAIEGTRVTVQAISNQPIDRAGMEMNCDPRRWLKMSSTATTAATGQFNLLMQRDDPGRAECESYQIRFTDPFGNKNRRPIRHRIGVIPDLKPEVRLVDPPPEEIDLPENGILELRVHAEDPDFALRSVSLRAERDGRSLPIRPLLEKRPPELPHEGPLVGDYRFEPARLGLKAGDKVTYWAEALDNKEEFNNKLDQWRPAPNRSETPRRRITIVAADRSQSPEEAPQDPGQEPGQEPPDSQDQPAQQPNEPPPGQDDAAGQDKPAERPEDQPQPGEQQDQGQGNSEQQQPGQEGAESESDGQNGQPNPQDAGQDPKQQPGEQSQSGGQGKGSESDSQTGESQPSESGGKGQEPSGDQSNQRQEPIDGNTNPGDAIEEILRFREEQGQGADGAKPQEHPGDPQGDQRQAGGEPSEGDQQQSPDNATGTSGTERTDQQQTSDNDQAGSEGANAEQEPGKGEGDQAKGAGEPSEEESGGGSQDKPDAEGGDPSETKGEGGAGQPSAENQATPSPQEANQQRDKTPGQGDQTPSDQQNQEKSPSISPKDSDSQGDTAGDRSGGGEEGGGQKTPQAGTGTAGSNTESEQGASASDQQGKGETGTDAGDQVKSDRPTGQPASEDKGPGSGSSREPGDNGTADKPQDPRENQSAGDSSNSDQPGTGESPSFNPDAEDAGSSGNPITGGGPSKESTDPPPVRETLGGEDPNLEYARQQTNLALEYLEDQLANEKPDQELLDRLGWTRADLEEFARRWRQMRQVAGRQGADGNDAKAELDEALRSLGLRPRSTELEGGQSEQDQFRGMKDSRRFDPPPKWRDLFEAYTKSISEKE